MTPLLEIRNVWQRFGGLIANNDVSLVVGRGALIGELALITETTRPATATAVEPSTVLRIPRGLFLKMLDGFPNAAEKLRDILATRSNQSTIDIYNVRGILDAHDPK